MTTVLLIDDDNNFLLTIGARLKSSKYTRGRALKLGAVAFLANPFDALTLADTIESALSPADSWQALLRMTRSRAPAWWGARTSAREARG
jgi:hypothetical protein